jgi:hypothetical protein
MNKSGESEHVYLTHDFREILSVFPFNMMLYIAFLMQKYDPSNLISTGFLPQRGVESWDFYP